MSDLLRLRRHRFDALRALLAGHICKRTADGFLESNHLRHDIGLPEAPTPRSPFDLAQPMVGLRR